MRRPAVHAARRAATGVGIPMSIQGSPRMASAIPPREWGCESRTWKGAAGRAEGCSIAARVMIIGTVRDCHPGLRVAERCIVDGCTAATENTGMRT